MPEESGCTALAERSKLGSDSLASIAYIASKNQSSVVNKQSQNGDYEEEANEKHWTILKKAIHTTADEILGEKAKTIRSGWYDKECEEATKRKNLAYKEMIQKHHTRNSEERYREERREEKKIHRRKKKIYFEEQLQRIEELNTQK
ncbi:hypothetical protein C0J52_11083 [Blattella germanica]|nr:hypothetical protein C0J52_11083 [Blattella germanica]